MRKRGRPISYEPVEAKAVSVLAEREFTWEDIARITARSLSTVQKMAKDGDGMLAQAKGEAS